MQEDGTVKRVELVAYGPHTEVLRSIETEAVSYRVVVKDAETLMQSTLADTVSAWRDGAPWFVMDWRGVVRSVVWSVGSFVR